jgi:hypothetical protein
MNRSLSPIGVNEASVSFENSLPLCKAGLRKTFFQRTSAGRKPGVLAEGSPLSAPASFVAGVFEQLDTPGSVLP